MFTPFLFLLLSTSSSFRRNCPGVFSVTIGWIVLTFGDLIFMNMKLCKPVSKCKEIKVQHVLYYILFCCDQRSN